MDLALLAMWVLGEPVTAPNYELDVVLLMAKNNRFNFFFKFLAL